MPNKWITLSDLSATSKISKSRLNYWIKRELLDFKKEGRVRFFDKEKSLKTIAKIKELKKAEYTLSEIQEKLKKSK